MVQRHGRTVGRQTAKQGRGTEMPELQPLPKAHVIPNHTFWDFHTAFSEEKTPIRIALSQKIRTEFGDALAQAGLYDDHVDAFVQIYTKALDMLAEKLNSGAGDIEAIHVCDVDGNLHRDSFASEYRATSNELFKFLVLKKFAQDNPNFLKQGQSESGHSWEEMHARGIARESSDAAPEYHRVAESGALRIGKKRQPETSGRGELDKSYEPIDIDREALKAIHTQCTAMGEAAILRAFDAKASGETLDNPQQAQRFKSKVSILQNHTGDTLRMGNQKGHAVFAEAVNNSLELLEKWIDGEQCSGRSFTALQAMKQFGNFYNAEMDGLNNGEAMNLLGDAYGSKEAFLAMAGKQGNQLSIQVFDAANKSIARDTARGR